MNEEAFAGLLQPIVLSVIQGMRTHAGPAGVCGVAAGAGGRGVDAQGWGVGGGNDLVLGVPSARLCVVTLVHMASLWVDGEGLVGDGGGVGGAGRRRLRIEGFQSFFLPVCGRALFACAGAAASNANDAQVCVCDSSPLSSECVSYRMSSHTLFGCAYVRVCECVACSCACACVGGWVGGRREVAC